MEQWKFLKTLHLIPFHSFLDVAPNANCYFSLINSNPLELRSKLLMIGKNKSQQKGISLFVELCLCAPFKRATLERFFSNMNIIKILNQLKHIFVSQNVWLIPFKICAQLSYVLLQILGGLENSEVVYFPRAEIF